jgi:hypothetical protein
MKRNLIYVLITILYLLPSFSSGQMIDSMMKVYAERYPQEKVYLQFDKKAYNPGERIWYKAFIFSGFDPSPYSKNFYAELFDANGNLILRNVSPILRSSASGSFDLPATFSGTRIRVRGYTSWMLNFDTSFVFVKDLRVIGTSQDSASHLNIPPISLHFFPEGGDLVAGLENNIAFKAADTFGLPHKISGILYDQTGKELMTFSSTHNGMGKFLLAPDKQDVFYAIWKDEKGTEHRTDLPAVRTSGIAMRVINLDKKVVFSISRPEESLANQQVIIIAHMNQQMVYRAIVNLKNTTMSGGNIPTDELPTGILQLTVFDMNGIPLAERICFIDNHNYSSEAQLTMSAKSLKKRGRNVLEIALTDTAQSNLSLAVTDAEVDGNRPWDDNIISSLLLTGDLKGPVKDPYYYFQNNSDSLRQQLDLVMLTHGWRRFKWEDLTKGKSPVIKYPIENFLSLNAEVLGIQYSRISKDESLNVIMNNKDSSSKMMSVPYVNNGKFHLSGLLFFDTAKVYYQFNTNRSLSSESAVIFKNGLFGGYKKLKPFSMMLAPWSADDSSLIRKSREVFAEVSRINTQNQKVQNLGVVIVRGRMKSDKEKLDEQYSSSLFSGGNATIFDLMTDAASYASMNVFTYLQSKVAGLQITNTGLSPTLSWRGSTPAIYLNEMQVEASSISTLNVSEIAMVKVFSPGSANIISGSSGGVIAVYTKRGADKTPDPNIKGLEMARIPGFTVVREFYSPDYLINPEPETDDIRTTLLWNPNLMGGREKSRFSIPFYNSDMAHKFRVILEGYNMDGRLIHAEIIVE